MDVAQHVGLNLGIQFPRAISMLASLVVKIDSSITDFDLECCNSALCYSKDGKKGLLTALELHTISFWKIVLERGFFSEWSSFISSPFDRHTPNIRLQNVGLDVVISCTAKLCEDLRSSFT